MNSIDQLAASSKDYARLLFTIGENRVELLAVEMQEELHRLVRIIILVLVVAVFGLLAGITLTAALVLVMKVPPATVLFYVTGVYLIAGLLAYWRLTRLLSNGQMFAASLSQFRKDRESLNP